MDHTQQSSFSYGATIYEALSVVVRPTTAESLRPDLLRLKALERDIDRDMISMANL